MDALETNLRDLVAEHLGVADTASIASDTSFQDDLGADSLDTVELAMLVEERFDIEIADNEAEAAIGSDGDFGKLLALVTAKAAAKVKS